MKSRHGIYYSLADSPYVIQERTALHELEFRFSSRIHRDKFAATAIPSYLGAEQLRYGFKTAFENLELIRIYRSIETRGFYVVVDGRVATCQDQLIFTDRILAQQPSER